MGVYFRTLKTRKPTSYIEEAASMVSLRFETSSQRQGHGGLQEALGSVWEFPVLTCCARGSNMLMMESAGK